VSGSFVEAAVGDHDLIETMIAVSSLVVNNSHSTSIANPEKLDVTSSYVPGTKA